MQPTIAVTAVTLHQGDDLRSCSTCGEVEYVAWTMQINQHHPEVRCTRHASFEIYEPADGQQFAASVASVKVNDASLADDLIEGVAVMLDHRIRRPDLAQHLRDLWDSVLASTLRADSGRRMTKARFLIGSAAFALLPSVPVPGDDDECEGPTFHGAAKAARG